MLSCTAFPAALSVVGDSLFGHERQKITPDAKRKPADTKVRQRAPPGWYLLFSGTSVVRKAVMISLVNQDAGKRQSAEAETRQAPAATAVWALAIGVPPQRVHFRPKDAKQTANPVSSADSTMDTRVAWRYGGKLSMLFFTVQLNTPEL